MAVRVGVQGGDVATLEYFAGMSVQDVLDEVGVKPKRDATITVNNEDAAPKTPVPDESLVVVTPKISNG